MRFRDFLDEAKKPNYKFKKIKYNDFERLVSSSEDYGETELDGHHVLTAWNGDNCIGLWYVKAKIGSTCAKFKGDAVDYSELDPHWPYDD